MFLFLPFLSVFFNGSPISYPNDRSLCIKSIATFFFKPWDLISFSCGYITLGASLFAVQSRGPLNILISILTPKAFVRIRSLSILYYLYSPTFSSWIIRVSLQLCFRVDIIKIRNVLLSLLFLQHFIFLSTNMEIQEKICFVFL